MKKIFLFRLFLHCFSRGSAVVKGERHHTLSSCSSRGLAASCTIWMLSWSCSFSSTFSRPTEEPFLAACSAACSVDFSAAVLPCCLTAKSKALRFLSNRQQYMVNSR